MEERKNEVLVYGTLRPFRNQSVSFVKGRLYDLGSYPGLILDNSAGNVTCEVIRVTDQELKLLDRYEGFDEDNLRGSLYIRRKLDSGMYVYEFNHPSQVGKDNLIECGNWSTHKLGWVTSRLAGVIGVEAAQKACQPLEFNGVL